jgi:tetratricopeptide (TPR) repeat protein
VQRNPRDGDRLFGLGQSHYWVGYVHWRRRNLDEALQHFKAYLDVAAQLGALDPGRADWRRELAYANSNIGSVLQERHDLPGALQRFRVCLDIERALLAAAPRDQDLEQSVAASHNAIGAVLKSLGRLTEALEQSGGSGHSRAPGGPRWRKRQLAAAAQHQSRGARGLGPRAAAVAPAERSASSPP